MLTAAKMTKLWLLMLLYWAWSPQCLPSSVSFIGTPQECEKAPFVPGYNIGGEGFDIVTMERKGASVIDTDTWNLGNGTCRLYRNTYMSKKKQKVPVSELDWRILPKCSLKVESIVYNSVERFANDSISVVSNDWKDDLNISVDSNDIYGGSHSKECTFAMKKSKEDRYTFFRHSVSCNFYRYRLATKPPLSHEFESAVKSLPSYSGKTEAAYLHLIDTYGTHYITQVVLGGEIKAITAIKTCKAAINGLSETEISDCLSVEASASFAHPNSIKSMMKHCETKRKKLAIPSFGNAFNERITEVSGGNIDASDVLFQGKSNPSVFTTWIKSLKTTPDVVKYNLKPLHTILPSDHPARAGIKQEVEKYIKKNAVLKNCSESCEIGQRSNKRDPCACVCTGSQNVKPNCCPAKKGLATLTVFKLYAQGLYGDRWTKTDGSVEVKYGNQTKRTAIIRNNDFPKWTETFEFGPIKINRKDKLVFTVYDEDTYWNSDRLGQCSFNLNSGNVTDSCMLNHGTFFFSYKVECAPSLGGLHCQDYIPTPARSFLTNMAINKNWALGWSGTKHTDGSYYL
ncbi:perforin-1-like [Mugil cephalus]|uniref:perforin-1-like n=1 Tax=Mugil cephalus TaxID=48193 RepID=UPI001FB6B182|nr:perforin-1-like [Mugil cephalus]